MYKSLFVSFFEWSKKLYQVTLAPEWASTAFLTTLEWLGLAGSGVIVSTLVGANVHYDKVIGLTIWILFFLGNYFLFIHKSKYKAIIAKYAKESVQQRRKRLFLA